MCVMQCDEISMPHRPAARHTGSAVARSRGTAIGGRAPAPHPDAALQPADAPGMRATAFALLAATVSAGGIGKFFRAHVDAVDKARPRSAVIEEGIDALVNIADGAEGKRKLLALGGLGVVAAAKKAHPKCAETAGDLALKLVAAAKAE